MLFLYHAQYHSEISLILLKCNIPSIVSKVNQVSKIRSFNFKFSLRFWPNNWIQIFLLPCLPVNPTLVIVSYFFHLIIQKLFINFFFPTASFKSPPPPQLTACSTPTHSGIFIPVKIVTLRVYSKTKSVLPSD